VTTEQSSHKNSFLNYPTRYKTFTLINPIPFLFGFYFADDLNENNLRDGECFTHESLHELRYA